MCDFIIIIVVIGFQKRIQPDIQLLGSGAVAANLEEITAVHSFFGGVLLVATRPVAVERSRYAYFYQQNFE